MKGSPQPMPLETAMKTLFDDLASALVSATLCVATVSMFIVVFASAT